MANKKITDFPENKENPFLKSLVVKRKSKTNIIATKNSSAILNYGTGEIDDDVLFLAQKKQLENEPYVKLFQGFLKNIIGLSQAGVRVFGYFMEQAQYDDKVIFSWEKCKQFTGYTSSSTILRGLTELLDYQFIARTEDSYFYFINPQIFYKGDRIVLITEYQRKKGKEKLPENTPEKAFEKKNFKDFLNLEEANIQLVKPGDNPVCHKDE